MLRARKRPGVYLSLRAVGLLDPDEAEVLELRKPVLNRASRAVKLFQEAVKTKDAKLINHASEALIEHRRLHIAHVLRDLKRIDPIQAKRKALS
ncbi:unnamed protein product [marine sediment metagenome]|uniref:Uncharacterized protein n=1 Tax=marine sediment metagenome TaxID=412755 RepID=X1VYG9_9ZZZZ